MEQYITDFFEALVDAYEHAMECGMVGFRRPQYNKEKLRKMVVRELMAAGMSLETFPTTFEKQYASFQKRVTG